jgi:ribonuclease P protein subunit POP4
LIIGGASNWRTNFSKLRKDIFSASWLKLPVIMQLSSREGHMVDKILHELLQNGDSAQKYMQGSRSKKIDNWILLDNFVQGRGVSTGSHIRALRIHSKRSKRHMSMKQQKKCGSFDLPQELHK